MFGIYHEGMNKSYVRVTWNSQGLKFPTVKKYPHSSYSLLWYFAHGAESLQLLT